MNQHTYKYRPVRSTARTWLRRLAFLAGGGLVLLILLLVLLRSPLADIALTRFVPGIINGVLQEQGLSLSVDAIEGPLPERLSLSGLRIADSRGVWLEAEALAVHLSPLDLLAQKITVHSLAGQGLAVHRQPLLAVASVVPQAVPQGTPEAAPTSPLPESLSVALHSLDVREIMIGPTLAGLPETQAPLRCSLTGKATLQQGEAQIALAVQWSKVFQPLSVVAALKKNEFSVNLDGSLQEALNFLSLGGGAGRDTLAVLNVQGGPLSLPLSDAHPLALDLSGVLRFVSGLEGDGGTTVLPVQGTVRVSGTSIAVPSLKIQAEQAEQAGQAGGAGQAEDDGKTFLTLDASAHQTRSGVRAAVKLSVQQADRLARFCETLFFPLLPQADHVALRGQLALIPHGVVDAKLDMDHANGLTQAGMQLRGMQWSWKQAQQVLGESLDLGVRFEQPQSGVWTVHEAVLQGKGLRLSAQGTLNPDVAMEAHGVIECSLADVAVLAPFLPKIGGDPFVSGPFQLKATVDGPLMGDAPLAAKVSAGSRQLHFSAGPTRSVRGLQIQGAVQANPGRQTFEGSLRLTSEAVQGAPLAVDVFGSGSLSDMRLKADAKLFGVQATSTMQVRMPGENPHNGDAPRAEAWRGGVLLDGEAQLAVTDWSFLRSMGVALTAEQMRLDLAAVSAGTSVQTARQDLTLRLHGTKVRLLGDSSGADIVSELAKLDGTVAIRDAFSQAHPGPGIDGEVKLGAGTVALGRQKPVAWDIVMLRIMKDASSKPERIQFSADIAGSLHGEVRGAYTPSQSLMQLERLVLNETVRKVGVQLVRPGAVRHAPVVVVQGLELAFSPAGSVNVSGTLDAAALNVDIAARDIPLALAKGSVEGLPDGTVNAAVQLKGSLRKPAGTVRLNVDELVLAPGEAPARVAVRGEFVPKSTYSMLQLDAKIDGLGDEAATLQAHAPVRLDGTTQGLSQVPVSGAMHWQGALGPLLRFAPLAGIRFNGNALLEAQLGGTYGKPVYSGSAFLADGHFEDLVNGVLLTNVALEARYENNNSSVVRLRAEDGKEGVLAAEGTLRGIGQVPTLDVRGAFTHLEPLRRDDLSVTLSGDFSVTGPLSAPEVKADVVIAEGEFTILGSLGGSVPTLEIAEPAEGKGQTGGKNGAATGSMDVRVQAPRHFFVRGKGLSSEWRTDLRLVGPLSNPSLEGSLTPVRGYFEMLGRNFRFADGSVRFAGSTNPLLDIHLNYTGPDFIAITSAKGTAKQPELVLSSDPPMPQDEIIAKVLFGKTFSELSRMETVQAANAARELTSLLSSGGVGALGVMDEMRGSLGLEVLHLGSSSTGKAERKEGRDASMQSKAESGEASISTLEAGKYVMDNVYVGVEQGAAAGTTGVRVEVELRSNVNLSGRSDATSSSVGLDWKKDY